MNHVAKGWKKMSDFGAKIKTEEPIVNKNEPSVREKTRKRTEEGDGKEKG